MSLWFNDPFLKSLIPLGTSSSILGVSSLFKAPKIISGANALPEGLALGPSSVDYISAMCSKKQALIVTDEYSVRYAKKVIRVFENAGFKTMTWKNALPEAPLANVKECSDVMTEFEPDLIIALGGVSLIAAYIQRRSAKKRQIQFKA